MKTDIKTITVSVIVNKNVNYVWKYWTHPKHIKNWCFASDDWSVGNINNNVKVGGKFKIAMFAKDGSAGFDFKGRYKKVEKNKQINYNMAADEGDEHERRVEVLFEDLGDKTKVTETFEMEKKNLEELQRDGWQSILNNFKKYAENNKKSENKIQKITPFLWFDNNAEEAVNLYVSIFKNSKISNTARYGDSGAEASGRPEGSVMTISFQLEGQEFTAINGGPVFKFTPAISLFVCCRTEKDIDKLFKKLSDQGEILMPLDKYPFSEKYAFLKDKFGLSWQLMLMVSPGEDHITPSFLFVGKDFGKAEASVKFYTKIFKNTKIDHISLYEEGENGKAGTVKHASFLIEGQEFMAMDGAGPHQFTFNESISFLVNCEDQKEIDYYWEKLSEDGDEKAQMCGWLKDKFGISWQIVPAVLGSMMKDPKKAERVMKAILQMKKIDLETLKKACET